VAFRESHPELTLTIDLVLAEADHVAAAATWGDFHPPAGMHVVGRTMHVFRIANEQISEEWSAGWEWLAQRGDRPVPQPTNPLAMP
jgi:predicted ester cyclase